MAREAPAPIADVVEEHLDEAAFLWTRREAALASPRYTIAEVAAGPEERLRAHLDALALSGPAALDALVAPALAGEDPARAAAAAAALAAAGAAEPLRAALEGGPAPVAGAVAAALHVALRPGAEGALDSWLAAGEPALRAAALEALAVRRALPASALRAALVARDGAVLAAALRAAPLLPEPATRVAVEASLDAAEPAVRDAAIEAGLRLGLRSAWLACQRAADGGAPTLLVLEVLATSGDEADLDRVLSATAAPSLRRAALLAAGLSGRARAADRCVAFLDDGAVARVAAEAYGAITGLAVAGRYAAPEPDDPGEPLPLDGEELDRPALPDTDAALPAPDAGAIAEHWRGVRARFAEDRRWLGGRPWSADELLGAFVGGPTRRRTALGRELAIRSRGEYAIEQRAWARIQLEEQASRRLVARAELGGTFRALLRG